jgi:hypothetical protein
MIDETSGEICLLPLSLLSLDNWNVKDIDVHWRIGCFL